MQWIWLVHHLIPHHNAAARLFISLHTGVEVLGTARVEKAGGTILQQLGNAKERSVILVFLIHGPLQGEDVPKVHHWVEVVRKNSPCGVRIADMHVVVTK